MSSPVTEPSSEWRRMTNKINTVLKTSTKNNDYNYDAQMTVENHTEVLPEIQSIMDFRVCNGSEEYLVSWYSLSNGIKVSWESESKIESVSKEPLIKFWLKTVLFDDAKSTNSNKDVFLSKLKEWIDLPSIRKDCMQASSILTPSKKRPRQFDELNEGFIKVDKKSKTHLEEISENLTMTMSGANTALESTVPMIDADLCNNLEFSSFFNSNQIHDLIDTQNEIGEVIKWNKNDGDDSPVHYVVTWLYVACETAETLGIKEEHLDKCFGPSSTGECVGQKFQLHRQKNNFAIIKEAPRKKSYSPHSESGQSGSSTIAPSVTDAFDLMEYGLASDCVNVDCQTVELDPLVCLYCQSRRGEETRLSSLRQRRKDKKDDKEDDTTFKTQTSTKDVTECAPGDDGGENEDDDLVPIEYEIEKILNYRKVEGTNVDEYYIRWKGFTSHYDTWEPFENLSSCDKALILFYVERVAERRQIEAEMAKNGNGNSSAVKKLIMPPLPPIPEILMEKMTKVAPISDEEVEMAFKVSKTIRKNARWTKKKMRKILLDLIGETVGPGSSVAMAAAHDELPVIRHQLLMLESERRKELILKDLKEWEKQLNFIARGRPEIVVENNYDLAGPPSDFKYINDNVLGDGVTFPDDPLEGCDCEDSCVKDKSQCCPGKHGKLLAYNCYKRLRVYPGYPIYECNKRCKCGPDCANRVVQDGTISLLGTKLCIFRTSNDRGWGVKTLKKIKKGTFVCLYAGEIITSEEAENRGKIYENQLGACYLFDLDYYAGEDDFCPYTIDATKMGNIAHFINHSCEPNLSVFNVWADCVDQNLPKLAFFALRDINKDEELTYDYGTSDDNPVVGVSTTIMPISVVIPDKTEADEESEENMMIPFTSSPSKNRLKPATASGVRRPCLCGTSSCRKVLF